METRLSAFLHLPFSVPFQFNRKTPCVNTLLYGNLGKKREYNDLQIWYCMSVILCAENVNNTTPRALAEYLTANTKYKWSQLEVVFLYSSMQSQHPLCAAVRMPNVLYTACWEKNNT